MRRCRCPTTEQLGCALACAVTALAAHTVLAQDLPALPDAQAIERQIAHEKARAREAIDAVEHTTTSGSATPPRSMPRIDAARTPAPDPAAIADAHRRREVAPEASDPELLVFVSFSMPHGSLVRLAEQARRAGAVLVFRGLAGATLREMNARVAPLARTGAAMQINPQAFARFGIRAVPTFVVAAGDLSCAVSSCGGHAQRVAGDVSLDFALERLARQGGALADAAEARLQRLRGGP